MTPPGSMVRDQPICDPCHDQLLADVETEPVAWRWREQERCAVCGSAHASGLYVPLEALGEDALYARVRSAL